MILNQPLKITDENYLVEELSSIINESQDRYYDADDGILKCKQLLNIQTQNFNVGVRDMIHHYFFFIFFFFVKLKFIETFKSYVENVLIISTNSSLSFKAENVITFVAKFLANFIEAGDEEHIFQITWKNITNYLLSVIKVLKLNNI